MELQTHPPPFRSTAEAAAQQNLLIMDAVQLRISLLQRIEQADEKLLRVINSVVDAVTAEYVAEAEEQTEEVDQIAAYEAKLKPMTKAEMKAELDEAMAQYERGEYYTLEEVEKESSKW